MSPTEPAEAIAQAAELIRAAKRITVLTGAGVSAESGVPTFRASDGLWEGHRIEDVASPMGWERNPHMVWDFYHARRAKVSQVQPNPGHYALAHLEQHWRDAFTLVTQNVDGLHQRAGSQTVLEIHGSLRRTRCTACGEIRDQGLQPLPAMPLCEECQGVLRPDIVWFHEALPPHVWNAAESAAENCDLMLVIGTSAVVYPAANLIPIAQHHGSHVIEFNLTETDASSHADLGVYGPSGVTLPRICAQLGLKETA